jgi:hypothetical protein
MRASPSAADARRRTIVLPGPHGRTIQIGAAGRYPAAMLGAFNPVKEIPLTLVSESMVIQGTVVTRVQRLTDLLNEPDAVHLVMQDVAFMEVGSRRVVARGAAAQVRMTDILFVHTTGSTDSNSTMRMPKEPVKATVLLPPFTVEGTIHLPYEDELRIALDSFGDRFVPVTEAKYWAYGVAEAPNFVDLLVVNHSRAHFCVAAGVKWNGGCGPRHGDGAQNPW